MAQVGFLGTGAITVAMVEGLAGDGHSIMVSERNAQNAAKLAERFDEVSVGSNADVVSASEILVLGLMPEVARDVLPTLPFRSGHRVISTVADLSYDAVQVLCAPAADISLTIPLPSIAHGGSPLPVFPDTGAARALFAGKNPVIGVETEAGLRLYLGGCATSLALIEQVLHTRDWLAEETGDPAGAETYLAALFASYFNDVLASDTGRLDEIAQALSTTGGFNATVRDDMRGLGAPDALVAAIERLRPRLGLEPK